jgi:hypothetical protein
MTAPRTDAQVLDRIEADALAYGGEEFLAEVRDEAAAWALEHDDPARWSAYLGVAWQLVDAHRAELVGQLVPTLDGKWRTVTPARCPAGHSWDQQKVSPLVSSWLPCRGPEHRGHHRVRCVADVGGRECGEIVVFPDTVEGCSFVGIGEGEG